MSHEEQQLAETGTSPAPWPPNWARSSAFMTGLGLTIYETVADHAAHLVVYGPAFALTGLPLAKGIEVLLDRLPWGKK